MAHLRLTPLLALLLAGPQANAADRGFAALVADVEADLVDTEQRASKLARDYEQRRGLIGAEEATRRYEDAVYAFLVGDYERAAMAFFVLVESEALTSAALQKDSQWYLAECLFELGNWNTALDAYQLIVNTGGNHPFFEDAVRRQLEVYGILQESERFYALYQSWILSGRVAPTDQVKYTVGKSFWRQGENARAKALFMEIPVGGGFYARARYFMGAVLASEGEFQAAAAEFARVAELESAGPVRELAWLALARVLYEIGEYDQALAAYRNIPAGSTYLADQLYEMVWAYIKQGDWEGALQQTEIFLIAFPEHPYALQLKLDMGHLHMKNTSYEKALAAYETVVDDYTPLQRQLARIEATREDIGTYFERMVAGDALDAGNAALPDFARALLTGNDEVARAVDASRALRSQQSDLDDSRSAAREVDAVLSSSNDAIGTFARGRTGVTRVRDDALGLRIRLLS
ncbi:MAG: tetratricopeptide repeat protein, partial [Myxococcota bacterium]|nr:tetratricopeptide repeat protein [Myxococcota bacterium]